MRTVAHLWRLIAVAGLSLLALAGTFVPAAAVDVDPKLPITERVTPDVFAAVFPDGDRLGAPEGTPANLAVYKGEELLGYIFSTYDVVRAPGYSSTPFDVLAGVALDGKITGAVVTFQREPHINDSVQRSEKLDDFLARQNGLPMNGSVRGVGPDFVAGATISARAMRAAILDSARIVMVQRGHVRKVTEPTLDTQGFRILTVDQMYQEGVLAHRVITNTELAELFAAAGAPGATPEISTRGGPTEEYIDLNIMLATPMTAGRNFIGGSYERSVQGLPDGTYAIVIASEGRYDFLGNRYHRAAFGNRFDRFRIVQGEHTWEYVRDQFTRISLGRISPYFFPYAALFKVTEDEGFDPLQPWTVELMIHGTKPDGAETTITVPLEYRIPPALVLMPEPPPTPVWVEAWQEARVDLIILVSALLVLTLILVFQHQLTKYRKIYRPLRNLFLVFTLGWLGWTVGGQLSTLHFVNYLKAPFEGFGLGFYLAEPLIVVLFVYTIVALFLLGRGVFCGWLCPFGALQELLAQIARFLKLPQWNPSERIQRRLWMVKYVAAAAVIGLAFVSPEAGSIAAEVEPFKTVITSPFERTWPFIVYAVALLGVGLFTERAYCRFLCPLGGTLALLDRLHLVDMLKRRQECGTPCQLCSHSCPVKAIEKSGKIKMAECFQCLDCQVEYHDDHRCPPLVKQRKQRARAAGPGVIIRPVPAIARVSSATPASISPAE